MKRNKILRLRETDFQYFCESASEVVSATQNRKNGHAVFSRVRIKYIIYLHAIQGNVFDFKADGSSRRMSEVPVDTITTIALLHWTENFTETCLIL